MSKRVTIGDMVYLTRDREGIVRFKGKTGFGLGEWYGIELRTDHKTRHDGLIHNKRYFRCPRNKGLFVRKQIIKEIMDKKTACQKTRVFQHGGTHKNRKIRRKYNQQTQKKAAKKQKKTIKNNNKMKKKTPIKEKQDEKDDEKEEKNIKIANKIKKKHRKSSSIIEKEGDDTKYIKLLDFIPNPQPQLQADEEKEEEKEEEAKDFSAKESFSNPKSRKYFGKDQVFTGLDRRRSKYEDILLIDPNSLLVHQPNDKIHKKLGTKRRNNKKKASKNIPKKNIKSIILTTVVEEDDKKNDESLAIESDSDSSSPIPSQTSTNNTKSLEVNTITTTLKPTQHSTAVSTQYSPFMDTTSSLSSGPSPSPRYRPFGGDTSPKGQLPLHIKQMSMEFSKGNLKAKLKKVIPIKRQKRTGTIRNVYEKYATKADYPKLDDLRNETLVSEFLSFNLYNTYRDERNIIQDYTIDRAIECGCFYLPDPIGFRLADFKTYEVFQDLCDELLSILHDEWNPTDRPHKKNIDWRLLINMNQNVSIDMSMGIASKTVFKRSQSRYAYEYGGGGRKKRSRGVSLAVSLREKRKKSKRKNSSGTATIANSDVGDGICEESELNITPANIDDYKQSTTPPVYTSDNKQDEDEKTERKILIKKRKKEEKRRKSHKRLKQTGSVGGIHVRSSLQNSSFMMARLQLWDNDYVSSCRITLSRNLHGFRFSNVISRNERRNLEKMLSSVLSQCNEGALKGRYRPYHKINATKLPLLVETDKLFPKPDAPGLIMAGYARDWPQSRGIFINNNKNLYIWCNYLEHLHLISVQNDGNILQCFKRLFDCEDKLESLIKQRQQIFLDNLYKRQQDILARELKYTNVATDKILSSKQAPIETPTNENNEQMLVSETPTNEDTITFTDLVQKQKQQEKIKQSQEKKEKKNKHRGLRLTKQEYKIKKMNFSELYSEIGFVFDDELGYISSNPQYFGTSMRVYVTVKLPNLICHEKFNDILEIRNLTAYQHDVDSAQQMFMAYASQLPSNKEVRERRNSSSNPSAKKNNSFPRIRKIENSQTSAIENDITMSIIDERKKEILIEKEDDFMSNLNLPEIAKKSKSQNNLQDFGYDINEAKVALKTLMNNENEKESEKEKDLIHDDEDLGDVVNPLHYKEEITIYQTTSLGISEVEQVKNMVEAINCLIEMEKLLSAGNKLDERIKAEKLKKTQSKFKK